MRPIKFRVWNSINKKMIFPGDSVDSKEHRGLLMNLYGDLLISKQSDDDKYYWHNLTWARIGYNLELMQFTGLHDKNGSEIYENDIMDISHDNENENLYEVAMEFGSWWLRKKSIHSESKDGFYRINLWAYGKDYFIAGNTNENPHAMDKNQ